ncbi:hypothetical protein MRB53_005905 [Persea americana]|uniref:Uncharacterized protein n=1 Tax=Persea americana TaxID=3435 RepID=A0ACC2MEF9_PERAE|nr:hypothetical protein MRB53_005905 [Persea americana]
MEELMLMSNVRRKRPGPSRSKNNAKISKFDDSLERIFIILEGEKNEEERKKKERKEEEMKEKERKDEERKEEERKEKERKEQEMKEKDKERKVEEMKQDALFQQYENENISLEASNDDDNVVLWNNVGATFHKRSACRRKGKSFPAPGQAQGYYA